MSQTREADAVVDTVVVGGGVVGASVAYHLARRGLETLLVDRDDEGRATDAGAGIVSPPTSSRTADDDWFEFATEAAAYYPELRDRLERAGARETSYRRQGLLAVAVDPDEVGDYQASVERIRGRGLDAVEEVDPAEAVDRFPPLVEPERAFFVPDAARVDGRAVAESLVEAGRTHGLEAVDGDVVSLRIDDDRRADDGRVSGIETAGGRRIDAGSVVVAGGAWTPAFGDDLGVELPVEPQRGQVAHLDVSDRGMETWPIVSSFRDHYVVPWPNGRVVLGATRESGVGYDARPTAGGIEAVLAGGLRVAPGLGDATLSEVRVGLRPVSADGLPILGDVPGVDGAFLATGHGATGLTLGPYSGKVVAEEIGTDDSSVPECFRIDRFLDGT